MIESRHVLAGALGMCLALTLSGSAQHAAPAVDPSTLGPKVGAAVPPVAGVDQFGTTHSLATLSGPKGLMLVFSRSADW